jgi:hypothetical protein
VNDDASKPEDVVVDLFSSTDQYRAVVLRDRVQKVDPPDRIAPKCPHLIQSLHEGIRRCQRHAGHQGGHLDRTGQFVYDWNDSQSMGYLEER